MKYFFTFLLTVLVLNNWAQIPANYYLDTNGKTGFQLKTALYNIIKDHEVQTYNSLWTHFKTTDAKANGKVWDMYSDKPGGTAAYEYTFITHQCGNYAKEGDCYNREHSWPKSWFNDASPMYSDLFHLYPTDGYVNGARGNYPFGEVINASYTSTNNSKRGPNSSSGYTGIVFEPIDEYKGDFARSYFYMATRYENVIAGWENNESNADAVLNGTSHQVFENWYINLLLKWHLKDPVSEKEINRNNVVYSIQGNRNPFIDHPEYATSIWSTPTQVEQILRNNAFEILVNDNDKTLKIATNNLSDNTLQSISIVNIQGVICYQNNSINGQDEFIVNISGYTKGIYIVLIELNNKHITAKKLIIN